MYRAVDLCVQVSVLLKECADLRKRSGSTEEFHRNGNAVTDANSFGFKDTAADTVISSRLASVGNIDDMFVSVVHIHICVSDYFSPKTLCY